MPSHYVIKGYHWGYNDETFYPEGGFVHNVYQDEDAAKTELIRLERRHWRRMDLSETHVLFDGDSKVIARLNKLLMKTVGSELDESVRDVYIPSQLSDSDFMKFLDIADIHAYKIIETDDEPVFWAILDEESDEYLTAGEDESLIFGGSVDELKDEIKDDPWSLTCLAEESDSLSGSLEELSSTPGLLEALIISYNDNYLNIDVDGVMKHMSRDLKVKITTVENGGPVTVPLTFGLYKMSLNAAMRPELKFESDEIIDQIDIKDGVAYVKSTARGQCIDPIQKELIVSNTVQEYELTIEEW